MNKQEFLDILDKYVNGTATQQEEELLFAYYNSFQQNEVWNEELAGPSQVMETTLLQRLQQSIRDQEAVGEMEYHSTPVRRLWPGIAAAAAVIIMLSATTWYFLMRTPKTEVAKTDDTRTVEERIAAAGHNKAYLTLGNRSTIMLDSSVNGKLAQQGAATIIKENNGLLTYKISPEKPTEEVLVNTLTTPRGGQYQLVLPDGSKVWLNAASSIRYPTVFTGNERIVEIKGEAYFEVAKIPSASGGKKPFQVYISSAKGIREGVVEVLGTHFNVNAYDDEQQVKTTLLEGSVKVTKDAASAILKPGQQASLSQSSHTIPVQTINADQVIAWKNGMFSFKGADVYTVMRQIARWYDVQVVLEDEIKEKFFIEINRNTDIASMLKILEATGSGHFRMEGKKVVVSKDQ